MPHHFAFFGDYRVHARALTDLDLSQSPPLNLNSWLEHSCILFRDLYD